MAALVGGRGQVAFGALAVLWGMTLAGNAFSQGLEAAQVPVIVNIGANVKIDPPAGVNKGSGAEGDVAANARKDFNITVVNQGGSSVSHRLQTQAGAGARVGHSRGDVALTLNPQQYRYAEVSLHSVNGKRVLHGKAIASKGALGISRSNIPAGVYLLSAKGTAGNAFSARLTHSGGALNISVAFAGADNLPLSKGAADDDGYGTWTITVTSVAGTQTRQFYPAPGMNEIQSFTFDAFTDERDNQTYKWVKIGTQTWMAENLNYNAGGSACYNNSTDSCAKYGRLYDWATAMNLSSSCNSSVCASQVLANNKGVCPDGWRVPSRDEWNTLVEFAGGRDSAGGRLQAESGWDLNVHPNIDPPGIGVPGTDDYGFAALPGGMDQGSFYGAGSTSIWWSAGEAATTTAQFCQLQWGHSSPPALSAYLGSNGKSQKYSLRCLRNDD